MPCLLRTMELEEIEYYQLTVSGVPLLAIHFSCKFVTHGICCSLVAFLWSQSSSWNLSLCPDDNTKPLCLTRNCIKFQLPEGAPGALTLIDAFSHFELYVKARHAIRVHLCPSIYHTLVEGVHKAANILKYSKLVPKLAFLCRHENTFHSQQMHLTIGSVNSTQDKSTSSVERQCIIHTYYCDHILVCLYNIDMLNFNPTILCVI